MPNSRIVNGPMQLLPASNVTHRTLAVNGTAANFIGTALNGQTQHVYWTLEGCDARFSIDGTTPTASTGHIIKVNSSGIWSSAWANAAKIIAASGSGTFTISELNYL